MAGITGDVWKEEYDRSKDAERKPGPIELNRYVATSVGPAGIPTFMRWPVALTPEDLKAGDVDVAVIGAPVDLTLARRGAAFGPLGIRTAEQYLPAGPGGNQAFSHTHVGVKTWEVLKCVDYGDAGVNPFEVEESQGEVYKRVREIAETGAVPIILGGDHSLMRPDAMALADVYGKGKVGVVHFDAHYDAAGPIMTKNYSNGTMVRNLIEEGYVPGKNFVQIGLRGYLPTSEEIEWMRSEGIKSHYMAEIERDGFNKVMNRAIAEALDGPEYIFISFDVDSMDPAYMPGTGSPEPNGLVSREVFPMIRRLCAECNVVGMEVVEVAPLLDPGYTTAFNALRIIQEALTGLAMRKVGLTDPHYLDPRTSGQDPVEGQRTD